MKRLFSSPDLIRVAQFKDVLESEGIPSATGHEILSVRLVPANGYVTRTSSLNASITRFEVTALDLMILVNASTGMAAWNSTSAGPKVFVT